MEERIYSPYGRDQSLIAEKFTSPMSLGAMAIVGA